MNWQSGVDTVSYFGISNFFQYSLFRISTFLPIDFISIFEVSHFDFSNFVPVLTRTNETRIKIFY